MLQRAAVGLGALMALITATASPAAADGVPAGQVNLEVVAGYIVDGTLFPLGGVPDPEDDCATGGPSTLWATIDPSGRIHSITAGFRPIEVGEVFGTPICATLLLVNSPEGTVVQTGVGTGTIAIDDPGPELDVLFSLGCTIESINMDLLGSIVGTASPWDASLAASGFAIPAVQAGGSCSMFEAFLINTALGLPIANAEAELDLEVTEK